MTGRYSQLTYTSVDRTGFDRAGGGWQIQHTTGDLSAADTERLVAGVRTSFNPEPPLPEYPSPEQLESGPRRLAYRRWPDGAAGYWHTVPAGTDATGRPGNVFAHVVLDRTPETAPVGRPIQRWRAPEWLRPYGAAAVGAATLPTQPPGPGDTVTKDSVLDFALDTATWRLGTLLGVLDAVAAALAGGPPVVLGVQSVDTAAQWIGLVSFLMSAGTAGTLNFSTFDRADQLGVALESRQHLTAVPVADLPVVPAGVLTIDETAILSLGELGGEPHRTSTGQPIEVTPWSVLAQAALLEPGSARWVLDDLDVHAAAVADRGLHPAWPLAVTIAGDDRFADAHPEAQAVLAEHSPAGIDPNTSVGVAVSDALTALLGQSTADAWAVVARGLSGASGALAVRTYLDRALTDDTWLDQLGPVPAPTDAYLGQPTPEELRAALGPALQEAAAAGPQRVLTLVDLLLRSGIDDDRVRAVITDLVAPQVVDPQSGAQLARRFGGGRLGARTRLAIAAAALRIAGQRDGHTGIADAVLDWLGEDLTMPAAAELLSAQPWDPVWTRAALCGARSRGSARLRGDGAGAGGTEVKLGPPNETGGAEGDPFTRLWWLTVCGSPRRDALVAGRVWEPTQLLVTGAGTLGALTIPTLLGAPDSDALQRLANAVLAVGDNPDAVACATIRARTAADWVSAGDLDRYQPDYLSRWDSAVAAMPGSPTEVHDDAAARLAVLCALGTLRGHRHPARLGALAARPAVSHRTVEQLIELTDRGVIAPVGVVAAGLLWAREGEPSAEDGIDAAFTVAADRLARTRDFSEDDVDGVAGMMVRLAGPEDGGSSLRRYRKIVHKLLARRADVQPTPAAPTWRTH